MSTQPSSVALFTPVEGAQVILNNKGVFFQSDLYQQGQTLYAAVKGGFIRLLGREGTTVSKIRWTKISGVSFVEMYDGPKLVPAIPARKEKLAAVK